jgi:hypothetical protein
LTDANIVKLRLAMPAAALVVTFLFVLLFTAAGVGKVAGLAQSVGIRDHLAVPPPLSRGIGVSSGQSPRAKQGAAAAALQVWSPAGRPVLSWLSLHEH